jgi:pimeloyl-ACP methyl ester carboxylesterase
MIFEHHTVEINRLNHHFVTCGEGPAVLFCHGFPDLWRTWRHQMAAVANAGFRAIAPDLRGFGQTDGPEDPASYTVVDVIGDLVGILDHLGIDQAVIVGHDLGANVSWAAPLLRPDRFIAIASLSVPYLPRLSTSLPEALRTHGPVDSYLLYFLEPGRADVELDADPDTFIRSIFYCNSGSLPAGEVPNMRVGLTGRLIDSLQKPDGELPWFDDEEAGIYTESFRKTGFTGALNWYRSLHRGWELLSAWADHPPQVPALYLYGDRDIVLTFPGRLEFVAKLPELVPGAHAPLAIPGAGHFIQLEQPEVVSSALVDFVTDVFDAKDT